MKKIKDIRGQKINDNLLVLDIKKENNRIYYLCKCDLCGSEKWLRSDTAKKSRSCGCLAKNTQFKRDNLEGKTFGRLTVTDKYKTKNKTTYWLCKCTCGNLKWIDAKSLKLGETRSCGCLNSELASERGKKNGLTLFNSYKEKNLIENTNISVITRKNLSKNNTSGATGVYFDKSKNKWIARITFKGKIYHLGSFSNKQDAINARKNAEEQLFEPFLENIKKEARE